MPTPSRDPASAPAAGLEAATARVLERIRQAELAADRPTDGPATRRRRRQGDRIPRATLGKASPEELREARSLRQVFQEMGNSYREYRHRTGAPVSAHVKDAAYRFRREKTLPALAAVAASLDQVQGLTW